MKIRPTIAAAVITLNEAPRLASLIESLRWVDEIVVVDAQSRDDSVAIAECYGCRTVVRTFDNFANQRNHAAALCRDGQEITPAELPPEIASGTAGRGALDITIPEEGLSLTALLLELEGQLIRKSLERTDGNKLQAAKLLRLNRTTLIDKLNRMRRADAAAKVTPHHPRWPSAVAG